MIEPSSCLVVFVSRKAIEPSDSISMVNLMLVLIELRCAWNSSACSLFMHTWLSSTYLIHHLGEFGADNRAFSSTYSMTRLAKMALTGDPIGQPKICLKWSPWNTKKLLSRTNCKRAMIFWMDKFVLSGSDLSKSSLSLTTSMARWVGMQVNSDTTSKDTRISSGYVLSLHTCQVAH